MFGVFFAENGLILDSPVDAEGVIKDTNATVSFGMIELVTLVLEHGSF